MKLKVLAFYILLSAFSTFALDLTPQLVVDLTLKQSLDIEEINKTARLATTNYWTEVAKYDFNLSSNLNYEISQTESLSTLTPNEEDKTIKFDIGIEKKNQYGGTLIFNYSRGSRSSLLSSFAQSQSLPDKLTLDIFKLEWQQELIRNTFGKADRVDLEIALKEIENSDLQKFENIENLVLENLNTYWETYVIQERYRQSLDAVKRNERLLKTVVSKSKFGYNQPGELSQAKAELQEKIQASKNESVNYLRAVDNLKQKLQLKVPAEDLHFPTEIKIPEMPMLSDTSVESLRPYKIFKNNLKNAESEYESIKYKSIPKLNLVAQSSFTGGEEEASDALAEAVGGTRPVYYVGLEFEHVINSQSYKGIKENAQASIYVEKLKLQRRQEQLVNEITNSIRAVQSLYQVAHSSVETESLRLKNIREIERAYKQGRRDLNDLIIAYNAFDNAKTQRLQNLGRYNVELNKYAAIKDQLIQLEKGQ